MTSPFISSTSQALESDLLLSKPRTQDVIGAPVCTMTLQQHISQIFEWADARLSKVVCVANVHMLIEARRQPEFSDVLRQADMITPDGMPLAWMVGWLQSGKQERVAGMDILLNICERSRCRPVKLFFVGSTPRVLARIRERMAKDYPAVEILGMESPPFRPLTLEEDQVIVERINNSGAEIVLVSLGCPKQERWMNVHKGQVNAVMIGLGGAFPVFAGEVKWAPNFVRSVGLEWLFRLLQEPTRLWKRYASTIPAFVFLAFKQVVRQKLS